MLKDNSSTCRLLLHRQYYAPIILLSCVLQLLASPRAVSQDLRSLTGVFQGTARNASGVLQLGGQAATNTVFELMQSRDSLQLKAISRSGTNTTVASWHIKRVTVLGQTLNAKGLTRGPLHLRRSCTWTQLGGIRVQATITTNGASQRSDDFFGGGEVMLSLIKIRD